MKKYLIIFAVLFVAGLTVTVNLQRKTLLKRNAEISRLEGNWYASLQFNSTQQSFILKEKELSKKLKAERDSLAKINHTKSKFITKIIYQDLKINIDIDKDIPVLASGPNVWTFNDTINKCTIASYRIEKIGEGIKATRTNFSQKDRIADVYFQKRKWFLGKKRNFVTKQSGCFEDIITTEFTFLK